MDLQNQQSNVKAFYKKKIKRNIVILIILAILSIVLEVVSLSLGGAHTGIHSVIGLIDNAFGGHSEVAAISRVVLLQIRIPRICMGILVGVALSNSGLLMQAIFQNPLVSPYTLGISSGAAFGAALAIILGEQFTFLGVYALPVNAFIFAMLTIAVVYFIAKVTKTDGKNIVLIGLAIGYLFSALLSFLQYTGNSKALPAIVFWMMGSLANVSWVSVGIMAVVTIASLVFMSTIAWDLNIASYGRDTAISLGVNYDRLRIIAIVVATILTGTAVAFTGIIGFVGLIAPQMTRMLLGSDYRVLIPGSSLVGILLVGLSDLLARMVMYPVDLPIGIITSFVGVPFFLYLIVRRKRS